MFCKRCGKFNPDGVKQCKYCDCEELVKDMNQTNRASVHERNMYGEDKTVMGVVMCLFLGLLGLLIGVLMYPSGTYERESFTRAWLKTLIWTIVISVVLVVILFAWASCMVTSMY